MFRAASMFVAVVIAVSGCTGDTHQKAVPRPPDPREHQFDAENASMKSGDKSDGDAMPQDETADRDDPVSKAGDRMRECLVDYESRLTELRPELKAAQATKRKAKTDEQRKEAGAQLDAWKQAIDAAFHGLQECQKHAHVMMVVPSEAATPDGSQ